MILPKRWSANDEWEMNWSHPLKVIQYHQSIILGSTTRIIILWKKLVGLVHYKEHTMICWVLFGFNFTGGLGFFSTCLFICNFVVAWRKGFLPELVCGSHISFGGHAIFVGVGLSGNQSFSPRICDSQAILPLDSYRLMTWPPFGTFCNESSPQFHRMEFFVRNCDAILFTKSS